MYMRVCVRVTHHHNDRIVYRVVLWCCDYGHYDSCGDGAVFTERAD